MSMREYGGTLGMVGALIVALGIGCMWWPAGVVALGGVLIALACGCLMKPKDDG